MAALLLISILNATQEGKPYTSLIEFSICIFADQIKSLFT